MAAEEIVGYHRVASAEEIPEGAGRPFPINGRPIAVFRQNGQFYAMDDLCPHQGAPLSDGYLDGCKVICPWHLWKFSMETGAWLDSPKSQLRVVTYTVQVVDGHVYVSAAPSGCDSSSGGSGSGDGGCPPKTID